MNENRSSLLTLCTSLRLSGQRPNVQILFITPRSSFPLMLPELRKDPLSGRWVILAPQRAKRPQDLGTDPSATASKKCPFCPGGEIDTPGEVFALRDQDSPPNGPGWRVRIVPNKYPAVANGPDAEISSPSSVDILHRVQPGRGVHEVIIESPRHLLSNAEQSPGEFSEVVWAYRERLRMLSSMREWRYGLIFKNAGYAAGASLEHLHSQLVALPIVPTAIEETLKSATDFHRERGVCLFCDMIGRELADGARIVAENECFVALCPYAGRFAFETWILPKRHRAAFPDADDSEVVLLALMLGEMLRKLDLGLGNPAYNYAIRTAPFDSSAAEHYHWHVEIFPRVTRLAGFELSTDLYINIVRPEDAANLLRKV